MYIVYCKILYNCKTWIFKKTYTCIYLQFYVVIFLTPFDLCPFDIRFCPVSVQKVDSNDVFPNTSYTDCSVSTTWDSVSEVHCILYGWWYKFLVKKPHRISSMYSRKVNQAWPGNRPHPRGDMALAYAQHGTSKMGGVGVLHGLSHDWQVTVFGYTCTCIYSSINQSQLVYWKPAFWGLHLDMMSCGYCNWILRSIPWIKEDGAGLGSHIRLFSGLIVIGAVNVIGVLSNPVPSYISVL